MLLVSLPCYLLLAALLSALLLYCSANVTAVYSTVACSIASYSVIRLTVVLLLFFSTSATAVVLPSIRAVLRLGALIRSLRHCYRNTVALRYQQHSSTTAAAQQQHSSGAVAVHQQYIAAAWQTVIPYPLTARRCVGFRTSPSLRPHPTPGPGMVQNVPSRSKIPGNFPAARFLTVVTRDPLPTYCPPPRSTRHTPSSTFHSRSGDGSTCPLPK